MSRKHPRDRESVGALLQRAFVLLGVGVLFALTVLAAPAALAAQRWEFVLMFEGEEGADSNEIRLHAPLLDVGASVNGGGQLDPQNQPGEECESLEFELQGTVQPSAPAGTVEIRGTVDRFGFCGGELNLIDIGDFELTIQEDGSVSGTVTFPDEAEPRRITGLIASTSEGSTGGLSALSVLFGAVALVNVVATGICLLKRKPMWFVFGLAVSGLMVLFTIDARNIGPDESLIGAGMFLAFGIIGAPLTGLLLVGASRPGKTTSWWAKRGPSGYEKAPPPVGPRSDIESDET